MTLIIQGEGAWFALRSLFKQGLIVILSGLLLAACNDEGSSNLPPTRPDVHFSGVAFDALVRHGAVKVYDLSDRVVAEGATDGEGVYQITAPQLMAGTYRIEVTGGNYVEEFTGKTIPLVGDQKLVAYVNTDIDETLHTPLTYYTTIAAAKVEYLMSLGMSPYDAVIQADQEIIDLLGMDSKTVTPVDITDQANTQAYLTPAKRYGFFTAGVSSLTAWISELNDSEVHRFYNSIAFINTAFEDMHHNGQLDGQGSSGPLSLGVVPLDTDMYRSELARQVLAMVNHPNNAVGVTVEDILPTVHTFNDSRSAIFADKPTKPLNSAAPMLSSPSWTDGDVVSGMVELSIKATDLVGIRTVALSVPGLATIIADDPTSPSFMLDTTELSDGLHTVNITATNWAGGQASISQTIAVANESVEVTNLRPAEGEIIRGQYTFSASVDDPVGIESVEFWNGKIGDEKRLHYAPSGEYTAPWRIIDTEEADNFAKDGVYVFTVEAIGWTGHKVITSTQFIVDNTPPDVDMTNIKNGDSFGDSIPVTIVAHDDNGLVRVTLFVDGNVVQDFNDWSDLNYTIDTGPYAEGNHTIAVEAEDVAGNINTVTRTVFIDQYPPTVTISSHKPGDVIIGTFALRWSEYDSGGFSLGNHVTVWIDNKIVNNTTKTTDAEIKPNNLNVQQGMRTVKVQVTDAVGRVATDSVDLNFQHIATELVTKSVAGESIATFLDDAEKGRLDKRRVRSTIKLKVDNAIDDRGIVIDRVEAAWKDTQRFITPDKRSYTISSDTYTVTQSGSGSNQTITLKFSWHYHVAHLTIGLVLCQANDTHEDNGEWGSGPITVHWHDKYGTTDTWSYNTGSDHFGCIKV